MKKITIGLFTDSFFPMVDGVGMVVDNYAKRLSKFANVIVFAPKYSGKEFDDSKFNYKVIRCKSFKVPTIDYSLPVPRVDRYFTREVDNCKLDIVHIHSPFTIGKVGVKYAKKHNIPLIGTMHSQFKQDFMRAVKSESIANKLNKSLIGVFNKCDECWAVNNEVAKIYYEDYGYKTLPRVMNNATDMKYIRFNRKCVDLINKRHNIKNNEKVFLFVGRINNLKNVFFIVDSLKVLKEKNPDFKFRMLFVGDGQDEEELKKLISKNKLKRQIDLCGRITDRTLLASYYSRADLFLFPSLYDASSIVQIEAASQKTPTLFVEGAATACNITDNVNGFIEKLDKEKYADRIAEIMNNDKLYKSVSRRAYKDLYINWDSRIKQVYNLYLEHINEK